MSVDPPRRRPETNARLYIDPLSRSPPPPFLQIAVSVVSPDCCHRRLDRRRHGRRHTEDAAGIASAYGTAPPTCAAGTRLSIDPLSGSPPPSFLQIAVFVVSPDCCHRRLDHRRRARRHTEDAVGIASTYGTAAADVCRRDIEAKTAARLVHCALERVRWRQTEGRMGGRLEARPTVSVVAMEDEAIGDDEDHATAGGRVPSRLWGEADSAFVGAPMPSFSSSELSATHCYCCSMMSRWSGSELLCLTTLRTKYSRNTSTATPFWVVGVKGGKWSPKSRQIYTLRDGILRYIV
ncbi:uncharacterized protein LOC125552347 [Triticum urartu]|uniref:uncharacterized protein LOC125552347 n=1 Tax=Triticum urartu TaxID=4572 RepID=UPI0020446FBD|nr:uncharacterized protein LOC125552347 [Triticum urartu]